VSTGRFGTQHYSLITCDVLAATDCVLVNVVIRFEKLLSYLDRCIELQPLLVGRQADAVDVVSSEPVDDRVDRALGWGKYLVDLLGGVVFAIVGRVVYGADIGSGDHIAFEIMSFFEVRLDESDTHWQDRTSWHLFCLEPSSRRCMSALVGGKRWCDGRSKSSGDKDAGEERGQHLQK
jgi:hypothetical protein